MAEQKSGIKDKAGPAIPPRPVPFARGATIRYYRENKPRIIADIKQFGPDRARLMWGIKPSTFNTFIHRWGLEPTKGTPSIDQVTQELRPKTRIPDMPPFSECRTAEAQIEWLRTFIKLVENLSTKQ